ncbi:cyclin-like protein [Coprinopsis sp. MPI-PUGE-AT-0042]|nr:cyclin-like protein [Coprinopsis sp. MPI-PUGE-AT-0042]
MATDFWVSSHHKRWIVDRGALKQARAEDLQYVDDPQYLDFLAIYFANIIARLGKKLQLRQRVIATATVFFRRFYLKNLYCATDPFLVISACLYVAAKAEEFPAHIKSVITESRTMFTQHYGVKNFPSDNTKLAEMEFYLVSDLQSDLVVYHPYRTLLALCKTSSGEETSDGEEGEEGEEEEAGELSASAAGTGVEKGARYWGTGEGKLVLSKEALQIAWSIINDTYRSELCLLYPPHLIAVAALYLTFILHPPKRSKNKDSDEHKPQPRRSSRQASTHITKPTISKNPDPITFLAQLNVSLPLIATISQEIIAMYTLWDMYKEENPADAPSASGLSKKRQRSALDSPTKGKQGGVPIASTPAQSPVPVEVGNGNSEPGKPVITTPFLSQILAGMREAYLLDLGMSVEGETFGMSASVLHGLHHKNMGMGMANMGGSSGQHQQYAVNKMLERTMNAYG